MPTLTVVADAFRAAGMGHVSRSTALASAWESLGGDVRCFGLDADAPAVHDGIEWAPVARNDVPVEGGDVQVLDSYVLADDVIVGSAARAPLVLMHDGAGVPDGAALVVSSVARPDAPANVLAGPRYACLRRAYWSPQERAIRDRVERVLLTLGAAASADRLREVKGIVAEAVDQAAVSVAAGMSAERLHDQLLAADLVVCAGGQTMLEAAATAAPAVVLVEADNQAAQVAELERLGAVAVTGDSGLAARVGALAGSPDARRMLSDSARSAVDGRGALRVAEVAMGLVPA